MAVEKAHMVAADSDACLAMDTVIRPRGAVLPAEVEVGLDAESRVEPRTLLLPAVASRDSIRATASSGSPLSHLRPFKRSRNFCESPMASWMASHCSLSIFPVVSVLDKRVAPTERFLRVVSTVAGWCGGGEVKVESIKCGKNKV